MSPAPAIGIDLGTTNSCAAIHDGTRPQVIRSKLGYSTIPSVLTFGREGSRVVGQQAERQMVLRPHDCIYGSKRLLGRAFVPSTLERFQPHFAFQLAPDQEGLVAARIADQTIPLVEVSALILKSIRDAAESALSAPVERAVITVPAYFHEKQRAFVRRAGKLAGLDVLQIISEPTAAALAFGARRDEQKTVLVFDLGGGTFDVSIVALDRGSVEVIGVDGDTFLGGLDFDTRLASIAKQKLAARLGRPVELGAVGEARLLVAVRSAKHQLSERSRAPIEIRCFGLADGSTVEVDEQVTAVEFEAVCADLLARIVTIVKRAIDRARVRPQEIDEVLLVGGQTRMPMVQREIQQLFGKEPSKRVHPDEAVALGAAIAAYSCTHEDPTAVRDMLPMPIGTATPQGQFLPIIPRNTSLPVSLTFGIRARPRERSLILPLVQGDGSHVFDNEVIGAIVFDDLPGDQQLVELHATLALDAEGLLTASARRPGDDRSHPVRLATNHTANTMLASVMQAGLQILLPEREPPAPRPRRAPAQPSAPPAEPAAAPARRAAPQPAPRPVAPAPAAVPVQRGSAKRQPAAGEAKPGLWRRLLSLFRRG